MLNIVCTFEDGKWFTFVLPRKTFRPWQYTAEGDQQLLVSPATVEMCGIFITPIEAHFEKITKMWKAYWSGHFHFVLNDINRIVRFRNFENRKTLFSQCFRYFPGTMPFLPYRPNSNAHSEYKIYSPFHYD